MCLTSLHSPHEKFHSTGHTLSFISCTQAHGGKEEQQKPIPTKIGIGDGNEAVAVTLRI